MSRTKIMDAATAHHEAGHAVVAWCERVALKRATIVQAGDVGGSVHHASVLGRYHPEWDDSPQVRLRLERSCRIALGGPLAQKKFNPRSWRHYHGQGDFDLVSDAVLRICQDNDEHQRALLRVMHIETQIIVDRRWSLICAVAKELLERRTMTGPELKATIQAWYESDFQSKTAARKRAA